MLDAREFYLGISDDDILHGFRKAAGLAAPGKPLGGWCKDDSSMVFGQWLSGMARLQCATGDKAVADKAALLMNEWARTIKSNGDCRMGHYQFDKLVCGLVDMKRYAGNADAEVLLDKTSDFARRSLKHDGMVVEPAHNTKYYGLPRNGTRSQESLPRVPAHRQSEVQGLCRALALPQYWNKFANTAAAVGAQGFMRESCELVRQRRQALRGHRQSDYLRIIRNAYTTCRRPVLCRRLRSNERLMSRAGARQSVGDTFRHVQKPSADPGPGSAFAYLMQFTGEARSGDWIERLFYNGVGASLSLRPGGRNFYYSDYRISGGMKVDYWENFTCCSATYIQNMADYHNLIYYGDAAGLYVNLYVPSEVTWAGPQGELRVVQETDYPVTGASTLIIATAAKLPVPIKFRVPGWSRGMAIRVNRADTGAACMPGEWAVISRAWRKAIASSSDPARFPHGSGGCAASRSHCRRQGTGGFRVGLQLSRPCIRTAQDGGRTQSLADRR
jgi:hypothetical protein